MMAKGKGLFGAFRDKKAESTKPYGARPSPVIGSHGGARSSSQPGAENATALIEIDFGRTTTANDLEFLFGAAEAPVEGGSLILDPFVAAKTAWSIPASEGDEFNFECHVSVVRASRNGNPPSARAGALFISEDDKIVGWWKQIPLPGTIGAVSNWKETFVAPSGSARAVIGLIGAWDPEKSRASDSPVAFSRSSLRKKTS